MLVFGGPHSASVVLLTLAFLAVVHAATVPVIDITSLRTYKRIESSGVFANTTILHLAASRRIEIAEAIRKACTEVGFFYVTGHGVPLNFERQLEKTAQQFFDLPIDDKMAIDMQMGGRAWRGYFPPGGELTSGLSDGKEGLYLGTESDLLLPMHGHNLFPDTHVPAMRQAVTEYMMSMRELGELLVEGISLSLGLPASFLRERFMQTPVELFRLFHYPPNWSDSPWGVGEHTDYGVLTILKQDQLGGLEVKTVEGQWIPAPPVPGSYVVNIGDMLQRMTGGLYRSTPHRARNPSSSAGRYSFPYFFDPSWDVEPYAADEVLAAAVTHTRMASGKGGKRRTGGEGNDDIEGSEDRWDGMSVESMRGTYGELLMAKVSKVFPQLAAKEL